MGRSGLGGAVLDDAQEPGAARRTALFAVALLCVGAVVLPWLVASGPPTRGDLGFAAVLVACAGANAELGRLAEGGGRVLRQRPHKALSAWPFACALVGSPWLILVVVAVSYAWTRWRGLRVAVWKWVASGAIITVAGCAAASVQGRAPLSPGRAGLAALAFLATSAALFAVVAALDHSRDERWLRAQLRSPAYHCGEVVVLSAGASVAVLWTASPWFVLLALPQWLALQRALLVEPLRSEAALDDKTGVLRYEPWRRAAEQAARGNRVAVLLLDLDHFKAVNDRFGHLTGDRVLAATAERLRGAVREADLVGRFGGEEFCVLLRNADPAEATRLAERVRRAIAEPVAVAGLAPLQVTASLGVALAPDAGERTDLAGIDGLVAAADEALYVAKAAGRDRCVVVEPAGALSSRQPAG